MYRQKWCFLDSIFNLPLLYAECCRPASVLPTWLHLCLLCMHIFLTSASATQTGYPVIPPHYSGCIAVISFLSVCLKYYLCIAALQSYPSAVQACLCCPLLLTTFEFARAITFQVVCLQKYVFEINPHSIFPWHDLKAV